MLITKADKTNTTVIIKDNNYINKMEIELNKKDSYLICDKNPFVKLKNTTVKFFKKWQTFGVFDCDNCFQYIVFDLENTNLPRAYGLIKIHKLIFIK